MKIEYTLNGKVAFDSDAVRRDGDIHLNRIRTDLMNYIRHSTIGMDYCQTCGEEWMGAGPTCDSCAEGQALADVLHAINVEASAAMLCSHGRRMDQSCVACSQSMSARMPVNPRRG